MSQEKRSLLAVGLSVAVFLIWYGFFAPKKPVQQAVAESSVNNVIATTENVKAVTEPMVASSSDPQASFPIKVTVIESDLYQVQLSSDGGAPISWQMKKYKKNGAAADGFVDLILGDTSSLRENIAGVPAKPRYDLTGSTDTSATYLWRSKDLEVIKKYQFDPNSYQATVSLSIKNLGKTAIEDKSGFAWSMTLPKEEKKGIFSFLKGPANEFQPVYLLDNKLQHDQVMEKNGHLLWAGVEDRYFMSAVVPRGQGDLASVSAVSKVVKEGVRGIDTKIVPSSLNILPGESLTRDFSVYVGPKEMENLKKAGSSLEKAIDYGWFGLIAVPILYLLKFFYGLIHNYGVAIVILTVFVKLLLNPLSHHSMKSMKAMQTLQPKMKELKEKHKNDKERLNSETMQLFRTHKVNPMGGCLPMLIQLPIYIALYKVLWNSIELYRAPFFAFYKDLSAPDPYLIMPIILGIAMFLQQKMTPSASADPAQAKMMQIMPVMFTAFMLFLPSGLVLYILINTGMGVLQQWMMNKDIRWRDLLRGKVRAL